MAKQKRYWLFIVGKQGLLPHELHTEMNKHGVLLGREVQTWTTALSYLRDYIKLGYVVQVYESED